MEVLFEIRDAYELHSTLHGGFSIPILIRRVYESRLDLDEDDEEWITKLRDSGVDKLRSRDAGGLRRCAIQIGEIELPRTEAFLRTLPPVPPRNKAPAATAWRPRGSAGGLVTAP
jgi:hypothetical protein